MKNSISYLNIFLTGFQFDIKVILKVQTSKMSKQGMKVNLQIEEKSQDMLNIHKISRSQDWIPKSLDNGNKKLLGNYTLKNAIKLVSKVDIFGREMAQKEIPLTITFRSPDGKNFGKLTSDDEVKPLKINFIQNWVLDEESQHIGPVGVILEPLERVQKKEIEIIVKGGCQDVDSCKCNLEFKNMNMDPEKSQTYIVGSESNLRFDLELHNSGSEPSLVNIVKIESLNIGLPSLKGAEISRLAPENTVRINYS